MWIKAYSKFYTGVSAKKIWQIWVDINNWPKWHKDLEYCKLDDEFKVGAFFILKPKNMLPAKIMLTEINPGQSFTDCTKFFGAKMFDTHSIEIKEGGVLLTNKLVVTGPLTWLWCRLVAQKIVNTMPRKIDSLVNLAKSNDHV